MRTTVDLPKRPAWISYLRVSTHEQANKELSLPAQRRQIGGYTEARGMKIEQEFQEPGRSAKSMNRPAFRQMLEYVLRPGSKVALVRRQKARSRKVGRIHPGTQELRS